MSFLSFFKRKKKGKTDVLDCAPAEDVLQTNLGTSANEPIKCTASSPSSFYPKQPINITLVQGASDSKSADRTTPKSQQSGETSIRRDSRESITRKAQIASVQYVHKAPPPIKAAAATTTFRLYPSLDTIDTTKSSPSAKPKSEEPKSIHDMFIESGRLYLSIQEKILYTITIEKKINKLKINTQKEVQAMFKVLKKTLELQYDFNKELDIRRSYSHIQDYEKLKTFSDVKKCHQRANQPVKRKLSNNTDVVSTFQSYREKFMCYQGQKGDIVDCD